MALVVLGRNTSRPVARRAHLPPVAQDEQPQQQALAPRHANRPNLKVLSKACMRRYSEPGGLQTTSTFIRLIVAMSTEPVSGPLTVCLVPAI